jgi:inner membrane protein
VAGVAIGQTAKPSWGRDWRFWSLAALCSVLPDLDVLGLYLGIPYGALWGHRGLMHSFVFAAIAGTVLSLFVSCPWRERWKPALLFFVIMASHDVLDALTSGGLGIAFFSPFDRHRYFFPWTPIRVSPIGVSRFFSKRGAAVLWSEVRWVWIPALALGLFLRFRQSSGGSTRTARRRSNRGFS